ncbi:MAG: Nif3-like dinuclear metal center hexameric protein [Ruminococcus sp.]|nr:Nif3-like dinuclear metal center hexameric protein [Ruminococcus sp.]
MKKIKDILNFTETFAPLNSAMDFDNVGLLIGSEDAEVTKAVVALDITDEVIDEALKNSAQLIISHHPVIFEPLKNIARDSVVYRLIENNLNALCLHTNLDLSESFGVNTCLAEAVGVKNIKLVEGECLFVGELENETSNFEFAGSVKKALNCNGIRFTLKDKKIKKIAICSGSGGDYAPLAKSLGADALLTGEIKHHEILDAVKHDIAVVDAGHFKSENIVIKPLTKKLNEEFSDVEFIESVSCTDTIEYL